MSVSNRAQTGFNYYSIWYQSFLFSSEQGKGVKKALDIIMKFRDFFNLTVITIFMWETDNQVSWALDICLSPKRRQTMLWLHKARLNSLCWPWGPAQWVQSSFVASQHCLASFWRQTNIKISPDLAIWLQTNIKISLRPKGCMRRGRWVTRRVCWPRRALSPGPLNHISHVWIAINIFRQ